MPFLRQKRAFYKKFVWLSVWWIWPIWRNLCMNTGQFLTLLPVPQVCLEVRVAGCGLTVGQRPPPDWRGRRRAAASPASARTACWLKTQEAGFPQAAPPKLNTHSSVHRRLTLTETWSLLPVVATSVNVSKSYLMTRNDAALYISFHIFVMIKVAAQTEMSLSLRI